MGTPRLSSVSTKKEIYAPGNALRRFFTHVLLRRVVPVETRLYALTRNLFALASIAALIFRIVTLLRNAHNQIGTRMIANSCEDDPGIAWSAYTLDLLVVHNDELAVGRPLTTITMEFNGTTEICEVRGKQTDDRARIFGCSDAPDYGFSYYFPSDATFRIEVRSVDGRSLSARDIPDIWLSERPPYDEDQPMITSDDPTTNARITWAYVPPWSLRPGFHIEAEAQMVIRRFFLSSYLHELIFNSDPVYERKPLFPIVQSGTTPLLNDTVATATIRPTLRPGYAYLRDSKAYQDLGKSEKSGYQRDILCTFIDDYREGSILDVLGSIGGLFALLQSIHLLLFGRPMLWGLSGAKLIAPFGLLGICGSRDFKRRLRERYHRQPTKDNPDTFLMGAFLRDFVVDLGPANLNPHHMKPISLESRAFPNLSVNQREDTIDSQVPSLKLELRQSPGLEATIDIEEWIPQARSQVGTEPKI